ncbi:MAG: hypothetical protein KF725_04795 [Cyclobacteriaceae bacterium]|nr:hypothetical protein [Cyclobacteriaceae bacterium]UYN85793.1 MAG: hypothetical protein KIT51_13075 [Cyclobacteriaceae bacterium]
MILAITLHAQDEEPETRTRSSIIDDSTKQVYGPTTSRLFYEEDIFFNRWVSFSIDTVIRNFHRFTFVNRYNNLYQDLGNIGTAMRPVYYEVPSTLGATVGFDTYDIYWDANPAKYYNTRSPYSNMNVLLGGNGRSLTNIRYARNINPRWNFGFNYNGLFIDKQIQRQGKGDRNARSESYDLHMSYHNKDSTYTALFSFKRMYHRVFEYGGVRTDAGFSYADLFEDNAQPWLINAESNVLRRNYHFYQQYKVGEALQVYHRFDSDRRRHRFYDNLAGEPYRDFFDAIIIDSAQTRDQVKFNTIRNEGGIKGNLLKLFYNGYVALRNFSMDYRYFNQNDFFIPTKGVEFYVGGRMALQLDSLVEVQGLLESMLDARYRVEGSIKTKWFAASLKRSVVTPTFLQQAYRGSHDIWMNYFSPVETSELKGNLIYESNWLRLYPGIRLATFRNYVFFKQGDFGIDQTVLPVQSSGFQTLALPELSVRINPFKNTTLSGQVIYGKILENADNAIQLPELFVNAQLAYANIWIHGNFDFQVGVDLHWKSAYYAYGYDPVIQQFHTQQSFRSPSFPVMDVFLNAKIIRGRVFFRYSNVLKAFNPYGNIPTPFYPGVVNVFDFGFDWSFYD